MKTKTYKTKKQCQVEYVSKVEELRQLFLEREARKGVN